MADGTGVLVMAYGTPRTLDDVEEYYTDIRHGRPPSREQLEELTDRYRAIGYSPLYEITQAQAKGIEARLEGVKCYLGQKHAPPFIADAMREMADDGVGHAVGLVLAPHYSSMSIGDYERRARRAARDLGWSGELQVIRSWHLEPGYLKFLATEVRACIARMGPGADERAAVLFSAHSLPARILDSGDPYATQLRETAEAVAGRASVARWEVAWQSAGLTSTPWLGPDITEVMRALAETGIRFFVVCPCGFVSDHLEVLYDVDIEAKRVADELDVDLVRTRMPNDDPGFLDMLAGVVRRTLRAAK
jgi:protoporphyrin/coproporphyrin ferrochelatase